MRPWLAVGMLLAGCATRADADFVEVMVSPPGSRTALVMLLQGEGDYNQGTTFSLRHDLGTIHFRKEMVLKKYEVPTFQSQFGRLLGKSRDADGAMDAARWALKHGLLNEFYRAVDQALQFDPQHQDAERVKRLKAMFDRPLPEEEVVQRETEMRKLVRNAGMKVAFSNHFILLHDTPDTSPKPPNARIKQLPTRADSRLKLLEVVYESFLLRFFSQGVELEVPQERLKVVLFENERDYQHFATSLSPQLSSAIGFFDPEVNMSFFYNHATSERFEGLRSIAQDLQDQRAEFMANKLGEMVNLADSMWLIAAIEQENADIEVVSHECTHHIAANTGLLPRHVMIPKWVHEGLATYFEAPDDATWSGMGAVNEERLEWYKGLQVDPQYSKLSFVVSDEIFSTAISGVGRLFGYGQGWALTHFLMERHFAELMRYYRKLGEMPPDIVFTPDVLTRVFAESFDTDLDALDAEWRTYMRGLKTDKEIYLGRDSLFR